MNHAELYLHLVTQENSDQLEPIITEELASIGYTLVSFAIQHADNFPYICCRIQTTEAFSAQMVGFFVDIRPLRPTYTKPFYYLPIVVLPDTHDERFRQFINTNRAIEHEVEHIQAMLDLIRQDPDYPEKSYRYGMNSPLKVEDLPISIDLELFKLFHIEPPAMRADYAKGERFILMPFDAANKTVVRLDFDTVEEYVGMNMSSYVTTIKETYIARFAGNDGSTSAKITALIEREIDRALAKHGKGVFGPDPLAGLAELKKRVAPKFFLAMARKQFV